LIYSIIQNDENKWNFVYVDRFTIFFKGGESNEMNVMHILYIIGLEQSHFHQNCHTHKSCQFAFRVPWNDRP
ncbi:hypothetical protein ACJX0J_018167, partial [Zea mays]